VISCPLNVLRISNSNQLKKVTVVSHSIQCLVVHFYNWSPERGSRSGTLSNMLLKSFFFAFLALLFR
jgi:hypothetical protein